MTMPTIQPLEAGQPAPVFTFIESDKEVSSDRMNAPCLLYFYPKDDTPGCNKEACGIRDAWTKFKAAKLKVVGVSKDPLASHIKYRQKFQLPFPLIADTDLTLANAYGVYGEKQFMGRRYDGVHRISFLISADGTILKTYHNVKPEHHAAEVLKDFAALTS